jgi:hypothetical protein
VAWSGQAHAPAPLPFIFVSTDSDLFFEDGDVWNPTEEEDFVYTGPVFSRTENTDRAAQRRLSEKKKQGQLLLVSLLENFCRFYDRSPERNRKLFFAICKKLSEMGVSPRCLPWY